MERAGSVLAFDADDTLWHDLPRYLGLEARFVELLAEHGEPDALRARLDEIEIRNLERYGYGPKGFLLSMIETAIEVSDGAIDGHAIRRILEWAEVLTEQPVELLPGVAETLSALSERHRLWLVTKGDLFDQEAKIASSGLADLFEHIEIVSQKDVDVYRAILTRRGVAVEDWVMIGNSIRSDVLPALALGARAVHVPHDESWHHEQASIDAASSERLLRVGDVKDLLSAEVGRWLSEK